LRLFKVPAVAALSAIFGATSTMAEIPSPTLIGVQRVVIQCGPVSGLNGAERGALCKELVRKAADLTALPVSLAAGDDVGGPELARQSEQLLLQVEGSATTVDAGRRAVRLSVTPVRRAVAVADRPAATSTISFVKVGKDWVIQGPVDGLTKVLGPGQPRLHRPIKSDS